MAKKNIGATISLKDGGFKAGIKSAVSQLGTFKKNTESATSSLKKMGTQNSAVGQTLGNLAKKVVGVVAAYASFKQIASFTKECVEAANVQAAAEKRLETTMSNVKGTTLESISAIKKYAAELQGVTTIGDEATIQGASQLATFQLQSDTIKKLLPSLQDLAVAQYGTAVSGDQMQQMANLVGKVMTGNVSSLSRYGVIMDETQKKILQTGTESERAAMLVDVLGQNFGGLAQAMANTPEGRVQQLKNAWGDMQEVIGAKLYPVITNVLTYITNKLPAIQSSFENVVNRVAPLMETAVNGIKTTLDGASKAVSWLKDNWDALSPVIYGVVGAIAAYNAITAIKNGLATIAAATTGAEIASFSGLTIAQLASAAATGVLTAAQTALNAVFIASPIGWVVLAIGALIAIGVLLYKNWDTIAKFFSNMWGKIKDGAVACWNGIKTAFSAVGNFISTYVIQPVSSAFSAIGAWLNTHIVQPVKNVFTTIYNIVAPIVTAIVNIYKKIFEIIFTLFKVLAGWLNTHVIQPVIQTFTSIATTIGTFFTNVWTTITGVVSSIFTWFTGILSNAWQSLVNIFTPVAQFFGSIFSSAWNMVVSAFSGVVGFFQNIWNTIKSMFTNIGTSIANGISGAFKSVINGVIRFAGNLINGFIKSINWAIDVINKIPGVSITKLATVNLPMLANGGIIQRQGNVIVGERGPEMLSLPRGAKVTPLEKAGTTNHNEFNITIHAENKSVSQIIDELVPQLKLALSNI